MTVVDKALEVMDRAGKEIALLRHALLAVRERGAPENPCWCPRIQMVHDPSCTMARDLTMSYTPVEPEAVQS